MKVVIRKDIFGWFENASDIKPSHDPGRNGICLICGKKLSMPAPVITVSLMKDGDNRSYFYRTHAYCHHNISEQDLNAIESSLIDNI